MSFRLLDTTIRYPEASEPALEGVTLAFEPGTHTAILGPNGAGKSTLLRALLGLVRPESGVVLFEERPVPALSRRELARRAALVAAGEEFAFPLTVRELVQLGRNPHLAPWKKASHVDRAAVQDALRVVELEQFAERNISTLSAGELQRARLARALAQQADHLLLDEPVAHLDLAHELDTFEMIADLTAKNALTTITVTHHLNLASRFADRIVLISRGRVQADGSPEAVLGPEQLEAAFGCRVMVRDMGELGKLAVPLSSGSRS